MYLTVCVHCILTTKWFISYGAVIFMYSSALISIGNACSGLNHMFSYFCLLLLKREQQPLFGFSYLHSLCQIVCNDLNILTPQPLLNLQLQEAQCERHNFDLKGITNSCYMLSSFN